MNDKDENIKKNNISDSTSETEDNLDEQQIENEETVNSEIEDLKDSLKRLQADFINYKNRTNRERQQSIELANESLILKILPVIDDLNRAIDSKNEKDEFSNGIILIRDNLMSTLKEFGLNEVDCSDKFDPNFHHAVITEDSDGDSNKILEVFQKGYILNNKCIRPAMVKVSK